MSEQLGDHIAFGVLMIGIDALGENEQGVVGAAFAIVGCHALTLVGGQMSNGMTRRACFRGGLPRLAPLESLDQPICINAVIFLKLFEKPLGPAAPALRF